MGQSTNVPGATLIPNAFHSLGALLFGVIYGYLAMFRLAVLQGSSFLLITGTFFLIAYLVLQCLSFDRFLSLKSYALEDSDRRWCRAAAEVRVKFSGHQTLSLIFENQRSQLV
jgi:hypothetical protein